MTALTIALSKGRILDETLPLLATAGIVPSEDPETSRKLILATSRLIVPDVPVRVLVALAFGELIIELHDNRLVQAGIQAHHKYILAVADRKHIQLGQISVGYFGFSHKTELICLPGQQLHDVMERQGRVFVMLDQHLAQQVHTPECHLVVLGSYHLQIVPVALDGRNPARRGVRLIDQVLLFQLHQIQAQRSRAHLLQILFVQDARRNRLIAQYEFINQSRQGLIKSELILFH